MPIPPNHLSPSMKTAAYTIIIVLLASTLLFTAGCSDVGHKPLTFTIWVLKIDADGNEQWTATIDGDPNGQGNDMIQTVDGGYAIVGSGTGPARPPGTMTTADGGHVVVGGNYGLIRIVTLGAGGEAGLDLKTATSPDSGHTLVEAPGGGYVVTTRLGCLKRIDESGTVLWSTNLGDERDEWAWQVVRAPDGGYAAAGTNRSVRLDDEGTILWETAYAPDRSASTIITAPAGGFVTAGTCDGGVWVSRLDADGDEVWDRTISTDLPARLYLVRLSPDGTYDLIYGTTQEIEVNYREYEWITETTEVSLAADGDVTGERPVEVSTTITATDDGGYVYCGYANPQYSDLRSHHYPGSPLRVVRLGSAGEVVWDTTFKIGEHRDVTSIIQTADGGFALFGPYLDF